MTPITRLVRVILLVSSIVRNQEGRKIVVDSLVYDVMSIWTGLEPSFEKGIRDILSSRQQPLVLTTRVVRTWCSITLALKQSLPALITGGKGEGKSVCVMAFAALLGQPLVPLNLTRETEASELIGKPAPGSKDHYLETLDFLDDDNDDETIDDIR